MARRDAKNLKIAEDTSKKRCLTCKYFIRDKNSVGPEPGVIYANCHKWEFIVQGYLVCNSWAKGYQEVLGNENVNLIREYELSKDKVKRQKYAVPFYPNPQDKNYKDKFIFRYFAKQSTGSGNQVPILEIDKNQFKSYGSDTGLSDVFYVVIKLKWKIAGPEKNILSNDGYLMEKSILNANDDTLKLKEKKFTGIRQRLGNLLEFSYRKKA